MYSYVVKNFGGKKVWQIRSFGRTRFGKLKSIYNSLNVLHFLIQSIGSHTQNSADSIAVENPTAQGTICFARNGACVGCTVVLP